MKLLVDAQALIWAVDDPSKLGGQASEALQDVSNDLMLSAGTVWEIAIKVGLGKLSLSVPYRQWMSQSVADLGMTLLPITIEHADAQSSLPGHHRDPFDRLIVAQAMVEQLVVISNDRNLDAYGVGRVW